MNPDSVEHRQLEAARRISEALFQSTEVDELVEKALRTALEEVDAEAGSVLLADPDEKQLIFRYSIGAKPVPRGTAIPWDRGISGTVFQSGEPFTTRDVKQSGLHFGAIDEATGFTTRDMAALPLKRWKGDPLGVLTVLNKRHGTLDEHDLGLLTIVSAFTALAIEQARLFEEAKKGAIVGLLGDIGHDLKNLLQPIMTGVEILKDELGGGDRDRELCADALGIMERTSERIHHRVLEIADCVKGLSTPTEFSPCRLERIVSDVFQTVSTLAKDKQVTLRAVDVHGVPELYADERRLYTAFYNLIHNAIPETPAGGTIAVRAELPVSGGMLHLLVSDTGRGMPADLRDRLFTPRARSTKAYGSGLGTKIVKDVIDAHRGTITVESELGRGTTFHIRLPLDPRARTQPT
ncbi:MAG TPA: GAF domain-containing sensor histidine kinase [Nitrospirales bacterium]|nr:GAF domain-containing sensor histidine kinase [Nitrospirales bacterium]